MKKRILSLILALSMVLSVLPLGAFAEGSLPELVMGATGYPVCSKGTEGDGWAYNSDGTLVLKDGEFNFSYFYPKTNAGGFTEETVRCKIKLEQNATITGGDFGASVTNDKGTISGGFFADSVTNYGTINGNGTFGGKVTNYTGVTLPGGTIAGGTFYGSVDNWNTIEKGTFEGNVTNGGTISGGTFAANKKVENYSYIEKGTFYGSVKNYSTIENGTFNGTVTNEGANATIKNGTFEQEVINNAGGEISGGAFNKKVSNINGKISRGIFMGDVTNDSDGQILGGTFAGKVTNRGGIFSGTFNGTVGNGPGGTISNGTFNGTVENFVGTISGGTFKETVINSNGEITGGTFAGSVTNTYVIYGGVFNGKTGLDRVTGVHSITWDAASPDAKIEKVNGVSANWAPYVVVTKSTPTTAKEVTITADTEIFSLNGQPIGTDYNSSYPDENDKKTVKFTMPNANVVLGTGDLVMENGWPTCSNGTKGNGWEYRSDTLILTSGTYDFSSTHPQNTSKGAGAEPVACAVVIRPPAEIIGGTFTSSVTNDGTIENGTFNGSVTNSGNINKGTFNGTVANGGTITGGVFNLNAKPIGVTGGHNITWDAAYPNAKIEKVNGVSANWDPYVVVTTLTTGQEVTIKADTEIFSLNGKLLGEGDHVNGNKNTVKFTMPDGPVVLNGAITCTDLVMEKGWPKASKEGQISCSGTGWSYDHSTDTLTLTSNSGTYDFSLANPQDTTKTTSADSAVACAIESYATISGGIFDKAVTNDTEGMISGNGTFKGKVKNHNGTISGGKFEGTVINDVNGTISDGTFNKEVSNINGNISNGTFNETVINNAGGIISDGTFKGTVSNYNGTISGGTFAGSVSNNGGTVNGGIFNGNTGLDGVTNLHSITVASGAKIEKVNGVSANWAPYVVTSNATTKEVTITADTDIFSLNGQPIGAGNCNSSYGSDKTTVTFTMPDDKDVVLNGAITSTDLVMENGYPKDSNGGKTPCKGDGWEYIKNDPTNGDMLLLMDGLFDFSTIGDGSAVECNVFVGKPTAITGGEFNGKVFNNSGILGGTFHGEVDNMGPGRIENGTFHGAVENNGIIEKGTFKNMCRVINNRTIENGTFEGTVENNTNGTISGGIFAGSVSNNGGTVNGGVFNGKTGLDGVTDLHSITVASGAKIEKVNGVPAEWAPYVVTSNATTEEVTITADTEIFSLNGQPIAESSYGVDKKTVTFTMPDDDVVLNGELITKPEPEPKPEPTTYTVTVIGGTIDGKTSVSAKENDTLTVVLDQNDIPDGMTFDLWSISSDKLSGDINVDYRAEAMTFQMPAEDVTIRAQYRSAEIIEDAAPSPLATAATIAVGGAAAGIVVWQGVSLGVDLYLANALPQGVPVPTDRRVLALLLWETAGKPEVALPTLYGDIPAEEIELQKATRWAIQNGLMDAADKKDASFFEPDHYVTKMDVFGAWLRLKKLLGTT